MEKCIIVTTLSDNLDNINKIQKELLEKHLVSGCQVSEVNSTYWWNNKINESKEWYWSKKESERYFRFPEDSERLINKIKKLIVDLRKING